MMKLITATAIFLAFVGIQITLAEAHDARPYDEVINDKNIPSFLQEDGVTVKRDNNGNYVRPNPFEKVNIVGFSSLGGDAYSLREYAKRRDDVQRNLQIIEYANYVLQQKETGSFGPKPANLLSEATGASIKTEFDVREHREKIVAARNKAIYQVSSEFDDYLRDSEYLFNEETNLAVIYDFDKKILRVGFKGGRWAPDQLMSPEDAKPIFSGKRKCFQVYKKNSSLSTKNFLDRTGDRVGSSITTFFPFTPVSHICVSNGAIVINKPHF